MVIIDRQTLLIDFFEQALAYVVALDEEAARSISSSEAAFMVSALLGLLGCLYKVIVLAVCTQEFLDLV